MSKSTEEQPKQFCPVFSLGETKNVECKKESCAMYDEDDSCCAIKGISQGFSPLINVIDNLSLPARK